MNPPPTPPGPRRRGATVGQAVDIPGGTGPVAPRASEEEPEDADTSPESWGPDPLFKDQYRPDTPHLWRHGKQRTVVIDLMDCDELKTWNSEQAKFHPELSPRQILAASPLTVPMKGGKLILVANLIEIEYLQVVPQSTIKPTSTNAKTSS